MCGEVSNLRRYSNTIFDASLAVAFSSVFLRGAIFCYECDGTIDATKVEGIATREMSSSF
jgi:hypothetical protein